MTSASLTRITDRVYYLPHDPDPKLIQPTIGVVITPSGTVLYDCGNGTARARELQAALTRINAPPVRWIVYSHHHWDHIFGACLFPQAQVIGHLTGLAGIREYAARPWGPDYIRSILPEKPFYSVLLDAIDDWDTFHVVAPTLTFDDRTYTLPIDDLTLTITHVGGKHALDSCVLHISDDAQSVMFLGDCYYPRPDGKDRAIDADVALTLKNQRCDHYIDGHRGMIWR